VLHCIYTFGYIALLTIWAFQIQKPWRPTAIDTV